MQTLAHPFEDLKFATLKVVSAYPKGIRQSDVAKALGIPAEFDHNWITKCLLDGLVEQELIVKTPNKLFFSR